MSRATDEIQNLLADGEMGVKEKIELLRLQLDSERLAAEKRKFQSEQKFLTKHFAAVLTAIISLAAVLVSFSQVWVAKIQNEKELSVTQTQKDREMQATQAQKERENFILAEQQERARKLEAAKFIAEYKDELFGKDRVQRELMRSVILTTFPADFSDDFFAKLEVVTSSPEEKRLLRGIRKRVIPQIRQERPDSSIARLVGTTKFSSDSEMMAYVFVKCLVGGKPADLCGIVSAHSGDFIRISR